MTVIDMQSRSSELWDKQKSGIKNSIYRELIFLKVCGIIKKNCNWRSFYAIGRNKKWRE